MAAGGRKRLTDRKKRGWVEQRKHQRFLLSASRFRSSSAIFYLKPRCLTRRFAQPPRRPAIPVLCARSRGFSRVWHDLRIRQTRLEPRLQLGAVGGRNCWLLGTALGAGAPAVL